MWHEPFRNYWKKVHPSYPSLVCSDNSGVISMFDLMQARAFARLVCTNGFQIKLTTFFFFCLLLSRLSTCSLARGPKGILHENKAAKLKLHFLMIRSAWWCHRHHSFLKTKHNGWPFSSSSRLFFSFFAEFGKSPASNGMISPCHPPPNPHLPRHPRSHLPGPQFIMVLLNRLYTARSATLLISKDVHYALITPPRGRLDSFCPKNHLYCSWHAWWAWATSMSEQIGNIILHYTFAHLLEWNVHLLLCRERLT